MTTLHSGIAPGFVHTPFNWIYPNAAARLADTDFDASDINKVALELDTGNQFVVTAVALDGTPSWLSAAFGTPPAEVMQDARSGGALPVDTTGMTDGQLLGYNATAGKIVPTTGTPGPAGPATLFKGTYDPAHTYAVGEAVTYNGYPYGSLVAGNVGNQPDTHPSQWQKLLSLPANTMFVDVQNAVTKRQRTAIQTRTGTNLCQKPRPGLATDMSGFSTDHATTSQSNDVADAFGGANKVGKIVCTVAGVVDFYEGTSLRFAVVPGDTVTVSGYFYKAPANVADGAGQYAIQWLNSAGSLLSSSGPATAAWSKGVWQRFSATGVAPAGAAFARPLFEWATAVSCSVGDTFYADALLWEKSSTLGSYFDGSFVAATWSGTAYNTTSVIVGEDGYWQGRNPLNTATLIQIDAAGKAWFLGYDAGGLPLTSLGDPVNPTDAVNQRSAATVNQRNVFGKRQRIATRASGTNYASNSRPGLAPTVTSWGSDHCGRVQSTDIADAFGGANPVLKLTATSAAIPDLYATIFGGLNDNRIPVTPGDPVTVSAYLFKANANVVDASAMAGIEFLASDGVTIVPVGGASVGYPTFFPAGKGSWSRLSASGVTPAGAAFARAFFEPIGGGNAAIGDIYYFDGMLFEKAVGPAQPYFDGSVANGAWAGTAFATTSTYVGEDAYLSGTGPMQTTIFWQVDPAAKGWFQGLDAAGQRITAVGDATADTDAISRRVGDTRYLAAGTGPPSSLPSKIYAATGRECCIYWDGFLRPGGPPLDDYQFDVTCTKGEQDKYRWSFTPTDADAGTYTWTVDIYYNTTKVATYTTQLVVTASTAGSGVTRKLVHIGDSTTAAGNGAVRLSELLHLFVGDAMAVSLQGSLSSNETDAGGTSRTVRDDAVSGKTIAYMYSDPASPFVFSGAFNFSQYLTANSISLSANDWVLVHLGINDIFSPTDDATVQAAITTMLTQLNAMITNIKAAVSGVRIGLCVPIPPNNSQDAFGLNYGDGQMQWRYKRNRDLWCEAMRANYSDVTVTNVFLVPFNTAIDTRNNFPTTATPLNARNPATFAKGSNGVHPQPLGFWQMADAEYSFLKALA